MNATTKKRVEALERQIAAADSVDRDSIREIGRSIYLEGSALDEFVEDAVAKGHRSGGDLTRALLDWVGANADPMALPSLDDYEPDRKE